MENLNVKAVVSILGCNEHTLRAWERRYQAVSPARGEDGRRLYSVKDVERLRMLFRLVQQGHMISNIAPLSNHRLEVLLEAHQGAPISTAVPAKNSEANGPSCERSLEEILKHLERFDLERLNRTLFRARYDLSQKEIVIDLILPLMAQVGTLVEQGEFSIAQEHILSSLLRDHLGQIYHSLSPYDFSSRVEGASFALTTREGDLHEFGILIAAILCAVHGQKTHYLGPNMPIEDLVGFVRQMKIENLVLGLAPIPERVELVSAQQYLKALDQALPRRVNFWLGGGAEVDLTSLESERKIIMIEEIADFDQFLTPPH